jgi:hypothetical protein
MHDFPSAGMHTLTYIRTRTYIETRRGANPAGHVPGGKHLCTWRFPMTQNVSKNMEDAQGTRLVGARVSCTEQDSRTEKDEI